MGATGGIDQSGAGVSYPIRAHKTPVLRSSLRFLLLLVACMAWVGTATADALLVSNLNSNTILSFDLAGNPTLFADGSDGLLMPDSLALDANGDLFVANRGAGNILRFDRTGNATVFADA